MLGGKKLRQLSAVSGYYLLSWNSLDASTDVEALVKFIPDTDADHLCRVFVRASGLTAARTGYFAFLHPLGDVIGIQKYVSATSTTISSIAKTITVGTAYLARFRVNGSDLKLKVWADGDSEPASWDIETTDTAISAAGWAGLGKYSISTQYIDWVAFSTAGETASLPPNSIEPPSGALTLAGSFPATGAAPSTKALAITAGTPVATTGVAVYPSSGELAITTGTPTTPLTVMPTSGQMRITGQVPVPDVYGLIDFSGNTAQMQGDWSFVYPHDFAGETPASTGAFEFGMEISGETPASTGVFVLEEIQYADFMGNTPVMQGTFEFGAEFSGKTPVMQGAFEFEEENWGSFSGKTPAMSGSFDIEQAMDFAGKSPAMEGAFTGEMEQYGSFSGTTPAMDGSFDFLISELSFSGLTSAMEGAFVIGLDTGMAFSGNTPPTVGAMFIGVDINTDITTASDEIIRHRRGYDNG